jgi:epoxyqueuosine reductase
MPPREKPVDQPRGRVAKYAWGEDYHLIIRDKLDRLVESMHEALDVAFESKTCVDTSAIIERELAAAAGIGWIGKNTLVLNSTIGSYFFLGEIITDLSLVSDHPEPDHCGTCTRCLEACPTEALVAPYEMDARKCISYLTIEHRGPIEPGLAEKMGDWVFGCDICQEACPFNHDIPTSTELRFAGDDNSAFPSLSAIREWDEQQYGEFVRGRSVDRARLEMWKRNAEIAQRNLQP